MYKYLKIEFKNKIMHVPFLDIKGKRDGPCCVISAGMHGTEVNSIRTVNSFIDYCISTELSEKLKGQIYILPLVNWDGFYKKKRQFPIDNKDLNRCFGKKGSSPSFIFTEQLISQFYARANFALDFHDGGSNSVLLPHVRISTNSISKEVHEQLKILSMTYNSKIVVKRSGKKGMLAIEMAKLFKLPVLTIENGGGKIMVPEFILKGIEGIMSVLSEQGMIAEKNYFERKQIFFKERFALISKYAGLVTFFKSLGTCVHQNELIGQIYLPKKDLKINLRAPICGMIFSLCDSNFVSKSKRIYSLLALPCCHPPQKVLKDKFLHIEKVKM